MISDSQNIQTIHDELKYITESLQSQIPSAGTTFIESNIESALIIGNYSNLENNRFCLRLLFISWIHSAFFRCCSRNPYNTKYNEVYNSFTDQFKFPIIEYAASKGEILPAFNNTFFNRIINMKDPGLKNKILEVKYIFWISGIEKWLINLGQYDIRNKIVETFISDIGTLIPKEFGFLFENATSFTGRLHNQIHVMNSSKVAVEIFRNRVFSPFNKNTKEFSGVAVYRRLEGSLLCEEMYFKDKIVSRKYYNIDEKLIGIEMWQGEICLEIIELDTDSKCLFFDSYSSKWEIYL